MVGILAVADFRNSENWKQARLAVCTILELTESWSRMIEYRLVSKGIERLSIAVLDNIAKGNEGNGDKKFLGKAAKTIDRLEEELSRVHRKGMLKNRDSVMLKKNLDSVRESLRMSKR